MAKRSSGDSDDRIILTGDVNVKKQMRDIYRKYGIEENTEELLMFLIEEKVKRYLKAREYEDSVGVIDKLVTDIEDSLASLVEKYLKLKYPERYKGSGAGHNIDSEMLKKIEEKIEKMEEIFGDVDDEIEEVVV